MILTSDISHRLLIANFDCHEMRLNSTETIYDLINWPMAMSIDNFIEVFILPIYVSMPATSSIHDRTTGVRSANKEVELLHFALSALNEATPTK